MQKQSRKVTIALSRMYHYRIPLFEHMRSLANARNIDLNVVYGQASSYEKTKKDEGVLPWATRVHNRWWHFGGVSAFWQPFPTFLRDSDLVVAIQENRNLSIYPHLVKRHFKGPKFAYWGHGVNFQSESPTGFRERWKRFLLCHVDWWFAYTSMTLKILRDAGYPLERITCLNNAIDIKKFQEDCKRVSLSETNKIRRKYDIKNDAPVGIFCGSLYPEKKLDFLVEAATLIHHKIPKFRLIVMGDGPSVVYLRDAIKNHTWTHWVGVKYGVEKAAYFNMAKVILNPGTVGLHVLDAFSVGSPIFSTITAKHSPEVVYIENGVNGFILNDNLEDYAEAVVALINDPVRYQKVVNSAILSGGKYSIENMANNFINGIEQCLAQ